MINSNRFYIYFILIVTVGCTNLHGQNKSPFYMNISAVQDFRSNISRASDSLKSSDFRMNSYVRLGYQKMLPHNNQSVSFYYENQVKYYYNTDRYSRMEHVLFGNYSHKLWNNSRINISDRFRFRNYNTSDSLDYNRNILTLYLRQPLYDNWQFTLGYHNWSKQYSGSKIFENYRSHRLFLTNTYDVSKSTQIGLKNEFDWHSGNLYPFNITASDTLTPIGIRWSAQLFGRTILMKRYFLDMRYIFEQDKPENWDQHQEGEHTGDEDAEDLLAEDTDFDYDKHKFSGSVLFKTSERSSVFGFCVLQTKKFHHWMTPADKHRSDFLVYLSLNAKYDLKKNLSLDVNYNFERNRSNLSLYQYSNNIFGVGLRYRF